MKYIKFKHIIKQHNSIEPLPIKIHPCGLKDGDFHVVGVDDLLDITHPDLQRWLVEYVTYPEVEALATAAGHTVTPYVIDQKYKFETGIEVLDGDGHIISYDTHWTLEAMSAGEIVEDKKWLDRKAKLDGFAFTNPDDGLVVYCSVFGDEMSNLKAIEEFIEAGNSTVWEFRNGNELLITPTNLNAFKLAFTAYRQSFFKSSY